MVLSHRLCLKHTFSSTFSPIFWQVCGSQENDLQYSHINVMPAFHCSLRIRQYTFLPSLSFPLSELNSQKFRSRNLSVCAQKCLQQISPYTHPCFGPATIVEGIYMEKKHKELRARGKKKHRRDEKKRDERIESENGETTKRKWQVVTIVGYKALKQINPSCPLGGGADPSMVWLGLVWDYPSINITDI